MTGSAGAGRAPASVAAAPDLPLPGDAPARRILLWTLAAWTLFLLVALRTKRVWGGDWSTLLDVASGVAFVVATALAGVAFARCVRQASSLPRRFLWSGGLAATALATAAPAFLSSDVFDYVARGRVEALGRNPYTTTIGSLANDPSVADYVRLAQWDEWVMPYGPVAAVLQWICAAAGPLWLAVLLWKLLAAAAHVATAVVVADTARLLGSERDGRRAFVLWLWNPWLLLESCSSAHNEAFVALGLAAMGFALARGLAGSAVLGWSLAMLVKHGPLPYAPLLLADAVRRRRLASFALGALVPAAILAAAWLRYWHVDGGFDWLLAQGNVANASLSVFAGDLLGAWAVTAVRLGGAALVLALLVVAVRSATDVRRIAGAGAAATALFVLCCVPNFAPWYHCWWLPLFAAAAAPTMQRALELLAWLGPLSYLAFVASWSLGPVHQVLQFALAGLWPVLLLLVDWRGVTGIAPRTAPAAGSPPATAE